MTTRLRAHLMGARLDVRLAAGDPGRSDALAYHAARLLTQRERERIAERIEAALSDVERTGAEPRRDSTDGAVIGLGLAAFREVAAALRTWPGVTARGVALLRLLLADPGGALYAPAYPEEPYERAREALLALRPFAARQRDRAPSPVASHSSRAPHTPTPP